MIIYSTYRMIHLYEGFYDYNLQLMANYEKELILKITLQYWKYITLISYIKYLKLRIWLQLAI